MVMERGEAVVDRQFFFLQYIKIMLPSPKLHECSLKKEYLRPNTAVKRIFRTIHIPFHHIKKTNV
jgi:hypothetical protein